MRIAGMNTSWEMIVCSELMCIRTIIYAASVHAIESTNPITYALSGLFFIGSSESDTHQIYDREYEYPDNIQEVPEERKATEFGNNTCGETAKSDLQDSDDDPEESDSDVKSVSADERKK